MKDPVTKKSRFAKLIFFVNADYYAPSIIRGFGFVTFKSPDSVKKVLAAHHSTPMSIDEKTVSLYCTLCIGCRGGCGH